jgi:hypothetical protein
MFDVQVGSSTVLRDGGGSLPSTPKNESCATAASAASYLARREVFEGLNLVEGHHLRRARGAEDQQQTLAGWARSYKIWAFREAKRFDLTRKNFRCADAKLGTQILRGLALY